MTKTESRTERNQEARLGNVEFFRLTEEVRNQMEWIKTELPTLEKAAEYFSARLKFKISPSTIATMKRDIPELSWNARIPKGKERSNKYPDKRSTEIVARCLNALMVKMGEQVPLELTQLLDYYENRDKRIADKAIEKEAQTGQAEMAGTAAPEKNGKKLVTGLVIFKEGDTVVLDGFGELHTIIKMSNGGQAATLETQQTVSVERLRRVRK